jgi:glycerophosphoryl diester phosphodiesterase
LLLSAIDLRLAPPPAPGRVEWIAGTTFAHRGLHGINASENSPMAFAKALDRGLGIECDVQRSSEGLPVVFHDWELDRMTPSRGLVRSRTMRELQTTSLNSSNDTIPSLADLLVQVAGRVPLLIEVKSKRELRVAAFCRAIRAALEGYQGPVAVMSFDPRVAYWFARRASHVPRGLVVTEENARTLSGGIRRHLALWQARPDFLAYDVRDLPSSFAAAQRRRGLPVATWTVRTPDLLARARAHADAPIAEGAGVPQS